MEMAETDPKTGKADFGDIYNRPDAREYFEVLGTHEYVIPQHGADVFGRLLQHRSELTDTQDPTVLDVCCSYGIGGALFKTDLDLDDLYTHYTSPLLEDAPTEHVMDLDRKLVGTTPNCRRSHGRRHRCRRSGSAVRQSTSAS